MVNTYEPYFGTKRRFQGATGSNAEIPRTTEDLEPDWDLFQEPLDLPLHRKVSAYELIFVSRTMTTQSRESNLWKPAFFIQNLQDTFGRLEERERGDRILIISSHIKWGVQPEKWTYEEFHRKTLTPKIQNKAQVISREKNKLYFHILAIHLVILSLVSSSF
jgi:hypothetical protein